MGKNMATGKHYNYMLLFLQFPVTRIIVALFVVAVSVQGFQSFSSWLIGLFYTELAVPMKWSIVTWGLSIPVSFLSYYLFVRYYEKREITELQTSNALNEVGLGASLGAGIIVLIIGVIWILGDYRITAINGSTLLLLPLFHYAYTAVYEELIFRGVLYRIIEEGLGSWIALGISGLVFGFAHASVPNATIYSNLAIAILGGVIFSSAYMFTRRLWFAMGIHFAWNFSLVGIFGVGVSQKDGIVLMKSELAKSGLISGGELGLETSVVTFVVVLFTGSYFLLRSNKRGHFVKPFWQKKSV